MFVIRVSVLDALTIARGQVVSQLRLVRHIGTSGQMVVAGVAVQSVFSSWMRAGRWWRLDARRVVAVSFKFETGQKLAGSSKISSKLTASQIGCLAGLGHQDEANGDQKTKFD